MNTRTPLASPAPSPTSATPELEGSAGLDDDLRRFGSLSPLEQLERLEADARRITAREREMRAAESTLNGKGDGQ